MVFSAYELYRDPRTDKPTKATQVGSQKAISMADRFKNAFSHKGVKVHFVGAWYANQPQLILLVITKAQGYSIIHRNCTWVSDAPTNDRRNETCLLFPPRTRARRATAKVLARVCLWRDSKTSRKTRGYTPLSCNHTCSANNKPPDKKAEDNPNAVDRTVDQKPSTVRENRVDRLQVKKEPGKHKHTMEVWFAGTHSDM